MPIHEEVAQLINQPESVIAPVIRLWRVFAVDESLIDGTEMFEVWAEHDFQAELAVSYVLMYVRDDHVAKVVATMDTGRRR